MGRHGGEQASGEGEKQCAEGTTGPGRGTGRPLGVAGALSQGWLTGGGASTAAHQAVASLTSERQYVTQALSST